jgi:hypothetical protein
MSRLSFFRGRRLLYIFLVLIYHVFLFLTFTLYNKQTPPPDFPQPQLLEPIDTQHIAELQETDLIEREKLQVQIDNNFPLNFPGPGN